ncbi:MAG: NAD-dependent epimerase [Arenicellales bacterium]
MHVLITGGAGFIGSTLAHRLLDRGDTVTALDNLNDYYEVSLKEARLARLEQRKGFRFVKMDLVENDKLKTLFTEGKFDAVMNLAAQAGVRYSIDNPSAYVQANMVGFGNLLECCRYNKIKHLVFASSSSVYGANTKLPFSEDDAVDHPVSLYAASKKANELMAHTYAHLYGVPCTGLRFFTVYGPWGRPDMAFFKFTKMMLAGESIPVFNHGNLSRDFTYIDDIVEGVLRVIDRPATPDENFNSDTPTPAASKAPFRVYNIGNGSRVKLMDYIETLEDCLGVKANYEMLPMQDGDVHATNADITRLKNEFGFEPKTDVKTGLQAFVDWYREYYKVA